MLHLAQLDFLAARRTSCCSDRSVALLADAQRQSRLDQELDRLQRVPLVMVDEVGYIPFDPHAANLMFTLVSRRYERASLIVTSNKPFNGWETFSGDEVTAAAMIDRLVHYGVTSKRS